MTFFYYILVLLESFMISVSVLTIGQNVIIVDCNLLIYKEKIFLYLTIGFMLCCHVDIFCQSSIIFHVILYYSEVSAMRFLQKTVTAHIPHTVFTKKLPQTVFVRNCSHENSKLSTCLQPLPAPHYLYKYELLCINMN